MNYNGEQYRFDDLPSVIAGLVAEVKALRAVIESHASTQDEVRRALVSERLNGREAAKFLGMHVSTLNRKVHEGVVPAHDDGKGAPYYLRSELELYLGANRRGKRGDAKGCAGDGLS